MMLIDTSGLLCLHHRSEPFHEKACAAYAGARRRLTHDYVLAEFVALANARRLPRMAALQFVIDLLDSPDVETVWVDELLHREAMALLVARRDKSYSLADAVSFLLMRQNNLDEALTTDHHSFVPRPACPRPAANSRGSSRSSRRARRGNAIAQVDQQN